MNKPIEWNGQIVITTAQLAEAYGTTTKNVSNNFTRNRDKFIEGKHYLVLQGDELKEFNMVSSKRGQHPKTSIMYLWTRRGASRHCKILGTDKAWEQFDYLEEYYFVRKPQLKLPNSPMELLALHYEAIKEVDTKVDGLEERFNQFEADMPLLGVEESRITQAVHRRGIECLGGKTSNAYACKGLRAKTFKDIYRELKRQFGVSTYKAIKRSQADLAVSLIERYELPVVLASEIDDQNRQMSF